MTPPLATTTRSTAAPRLPHGSTGGGPLAKAFRAASRRHRLDVFATLILFVIAALAAGRVWRFPFDDEVITMVPQVPGAFRSSVWDLAGFYLEGGDIHPPLTFLFFSILYNFGIGEAAMRLCSLAMTATALALWQLLTLALLHHRSEAPITPTTRLIAVLLFGLSPLAIGQGDAIRWYPQFALFVALFVALYLAGNSRAVRLVSAIPLGLATSINLIAPLVIIPFAVYRYFYSAHGVDALTSPIGPSSHYLAHQDYTLQFLLYGINSPSCCEISSAQIRCSPSLPTPWAFSVVMRSARDTPGPLSRSP